MDDPMPTTHKNASNSYTRNVRRYSTFYSSQQKDETTYTQRRTAVLWKNYHNAQQSNSLQQKQNGDKMGLLAAIQTSKDQTTPLGAELPWFTR